MQCLSNLPIFTLQYLDLSLLVMYCHFQKAQLCFSPCILFTSHPLGATCRVFAPHLTSAAFGRHSLMNSRLARPALNNTHTVVGISFCSVPLTS